MRKTLPILTAVALALTLTIPASAAKPKDPPGKPPANEGLTCADFFGLDDPRVVTLETDDSGNEAASVVLHRRLTEACFDVPTGGIWTISLASVEGAADPTEVLLRLEDSMPGDACYHAPLKPYESAIYAMPGTCDPPEGEDGWSDSDPDQQVLYAFMVGKGQAAVEVTLQRTDG